VKPLTFGTALGVALLSGTVGVFAQDAVPTAPPPARSGALEPPTFVPEAHPAPPPPAPRPAAAPRADAGAPTAAPTAVSPPAPGTLAPVAPATLPPAPPTTMPPAPAATMPAAPAAALPPAPSVTPTSPTTPPAPGVSAPPPAPGVSTPPSGQTRAAPSTIVPERPSPAVSPILDPDPGVASPVAAPAKPLPPSKPRVAKAAVAQPIVREAQAQARNEPGLTAGPEPVAAQDEPRVFRPIGPGFTVQAGGGVVGFAAPQMRETAEIGGYWDARAVVGLGQIFGVEGAYVGAVHPLAGPGIAEGTTLMGNGAEGNFRINVPLLRREAYIIPFGVVGIGWMHYHLRGDTDGSFLARTDDIATFPMGGGLTIGHRHLFLETRIIYRFTEYDDLLQSDGAGRNGLRQWTFGANFGYLF
jgi:hypothetical protein